MPFPITPRLLHVGTVFTVCLSLLPAAYLRAQDLAKDPLAGFIDSLYADLDETTPGVAVIVLREGRAIIRRAYGQASIEHRAPFSQETPVRQVYSTTREFMCVGLAHMEEQGLLRLDDNINRFIPGLPAWAEDVRILDLLNHSSGFVDEWAVFLLMQASMTDRVDEAQLLRLLREQPEPQVDVHTGYMYCNSDFALLRRVMEQASGMALPEYLEHELFHPLDMLNTRMNDDLDAVIPGLAEDYSGDGPFFRNDPPKTSPGGNYRIVMTAADIEKWAKACDDPTSIVARCLARLRQVARPIPVLPGKHFTFGHMDTGLGARARILHGGVNDDVYLTRIPSSRTSVIIVSNHAEFSRRGERIVDRILGPGQDDGPLAEAAPKSPAVPDTTLFAKLEGRYVLVNGKSFSSHVPVFDQCFIRRASDTLRFYYQPNEYINLEPTSATTFQKAEWGLEFRFSPHHADSDWQLEVILPDGNVEKYRRAGPADPNDETPPTRLDDYLGRYYSPHLDYTFTILRPEPEGPLVLRRPTITDKALEYFGEDQFLFMMESGRRGGWKVRMQFVRDSSGTITGFDLQHMRLTRHRFVKVMP